MYSRPVKKDDSTLTPQTITKHVHAQPQIFVEFNGVKKRKIFYNVDYTQEEQNWIINVHNELKQQRGISIKEDQVILRFYYAADFKMEKCLDKLQQYYNWFNDPKIQCLTPTTFMIFRDGFTYSYGTARDGRPFVILNVTVLNYQLYGHDGYYQALNYSINKALRNLIPGYLETYYYLIDLDEQMSSLPVTLLAEVIKKVGNAYTGVLEKLMVINCTMLSKWAYNRFKGFGIISQQTASRIMFYTRQELQNGQLRNYIHEDILEQKYGGLRPNIDHKNDCVYKNDEKAKLGGKFEEPLEESNHTQYYSIQGIQQHAFYKEGTCCGDSEDCVIY